MDDSAKSKINIILFSILFLILFIAFIIAADPEVFTTDFGNQHFDGVTNESVSYVFNITINNTWGGIGNADTLNISQVNITLPSNIVLELVASNATDTAGTFTNYSGGVLSWYNSSGPAGFLINGSNTTGSFSFNATAAIPGTYNITVLIFASNGTNVTSNISVTINDTTVPAVSTPDNPISRGNISGTILVNVSITDNWFDGLGISYVNFTVINGSGEQNATFTASNVSGDYWNISLDTTTFADGIYNITIFANDTTNNINVTTVIQSLRIDNTKPTGSVSCTPGTVSAGSTVTCTCSPTDGGSGINTSATSNPTPTTSNTGVFTHTCTFKDLAGNSGTTSTSYTVELSGGGPGGGGGGTTTSFYTKTIPIIAKDFKELDTITQKLANKERIKLVIATAKVGDDAVHFVGVRELTLTSAIIEIASDPVQIELDVGEDAKVDVNHDNFYDIYVKLNAIVNGKADLNIEYLNEEIPEDEKPVDTSGDIIPGEEPPVEESEETNLLWLWIAIAVIVVILIVWFYMKKKS